MIIDLFLPLVKASRKVTCTILEGDTAPSGMVLWTCPQSLASSRIPYRKHVEYECHRAVPVCPLHVDDHPAVNHWQCCLLKHSLLSRQPSSPALYSVFLVWGSSVLFSLTGPWANFEIFSGFIICCLDNGSHHGTFRGKSLHRNLAILKDRYEMERVLGTMQNIFLCDGYE